VRATETVRIGEVSIHVVHDLAALEIDPVAIGIRVVVSGHSHRPRIEERNGVLYVNPGSAGPRRFRLPIAVARLEIDGTDVRATIEELAV
jgi:predicted phosphodiesterase